MQATITYLLSEQAQRAQMAATGHPVSRKQTMTIEVAPQDLDLFSLRDDGTISIDLTSSFATDLMSELRAGDALGTNYHAAQVNPDIVAGLRIGRAKLIEQKAEQAELARINGEHNRRVAEEVYRAFLADPAARITGYSALHYNSTLTPYTRLEPRLPADWHVHQHQALEAEIDRRNTADTTAKQAREAAKEQAKQDFIAAWFSDPAHADESTRQQFADGLLSREDALALIADTAFRAEDVSDEYSPVICPRRDCACGRKDVETVPREIYPVVRALKQSLPDRAAIELESVRECLRDEDGYADGEDASTPVYCALVKLPVGPFIFERLVRL